MGACRALVAAALTAAVLGTASFAAQEPADTASPDQIKQELARIKKGRTLLLVPAFGTDDAAGETTLSLENTSPFELIILLVGPNTRRVQVGPDRMLTLPVEPGDYEIALTVVGRDLPPFYGKDTITPKMHFRHKFIIPAV